jgi:hypothetical protein
VVEPQAEHPGDGLRPGVRGWAQACALQRLLDRARGLAEAGVGDERRVELLDRDRPARRARAVERVLEDGSGRGGGRRGQPGLRNRQGERLPERRERGQTATA